MRQCWLDAAMQFGDNAAGQYLAKFDAPLIETVDRPDRALGEHAVLVQCHQAAERRRIKLFGQDQVGWPIALGDAEWRLEVGRTFRFQLLCCLAEGKRLGLGEQISHQKVVLLTQRTERLAEPDQVAGDQLRALVKSW